MDSTFRSE